MTKEIATETATIALLTHAPSDLSVLLAARLQLPEGFAKVQGVDLQQLDTQAHMATL